MSHIYYRYLIVFIGLTITSCSLFCQVEGESDVTTIILGMKKDTLPPEVSIIWPQVDSSFTANSTTSFIYISGRLNDDSGICSLSINDEIIPTGKDGSFHMKYDLGDGLNVFELHASDPSSNTYTRMLSVIKTPPEKTLTNPDVLFTEGKNHGLIIGVDDYSDPAIYDLDNPVADATLLYSVLIGNYMFEPENVTLLKNPTRADIINELDELSYTLTTGDNLLIFYAGHGSWDREKETGYWLPADADKLSSVNWIRNSTIQDFIDDINSRHTLLITDACFAGQIFKSRGGPDRDAPVAIKKLYSMTSRKAMTSGMIEEVPDRSVFLKFLLKRLLENEKKYVPASELFSSFRDAVLNNSPNVPVYGVIQNTGDEGGEFIFIKR
jgi:hypothetical protein